MEMGTSLMKTAMIPWQCNINPGEPEICDGVDNTCNGEIDEGVLRSFHLDEDGDGFGHADVAEEACETPDGMVLNGGDCDDRDAEIFSGALEECDDIDNDCDGDIDEGLGNRWYADTDADGYGDVSTRYSNLQCAGWVCDNRW